MPIVENFGQKRGKLSERWKKTNPTIEMGHVSEQDPEVNDASSSHFFIFHFFYNFFIFSLSSSLLPPRRSFLPVPPSSSSLIPPRPSILLVLPSSSSLLPPRPSFFLVQHCLNHLESVNGHFSSIWTKALPTDQRTNGRTDGLTRPLIEMRGRI